MRRSLTRSIATPILNFAYGAGLYQVLGNYYGGAGVIFSLHRVVEPGRRTLHPGYMIHADVLDKLLSTVQELGWQIIGIEEVDQRLASSGPRSEGVPFACFTCDDGYVDNLTVALPIFRKHGLPFCVYITTGLVERSIFYWWGANEELVLKSDRIDLPAIGSFASRTLNAGTFDEKVHAYRTLETLCHREGEAFFPILREIYKLNGVNSEQCLDRDALTIDQTRSLASDGLVTIGAHCVTHERLSQMTEEKARQEMEGGKRTLEDWLDFKISHLAYPFGRGDACGPREFTLAKSIGFRTGVTTRQGNIFRAHRDYLACLPRRSIPLSRLDLRNVLFGVETVIRRQRRFQTT